MLPYALLLHTCKSQITMNTYHLVNNLQSYISCTTSESGVQDATYTTQYDAQMSCDRHTQSHLACLLPTDRL